ncbi:MAG: hypothetical protein MJ233_04695 [Mycoplasmoidaceae bacterium]|nr:hypothetical protein [Mycoplasmoidaceae bacterium]
MKKTKLIPLLAGSSMLVAITPAIVGCTCSHGPTPPEPVITDNILVNNIGRQSATFTLDKSHFEPEEAKDGFSTTITLHKPDEVA